MPTTNILDLNNRLEQLEKSGGGSGGGGAADDVTYDPTASGLQATNVQDAIDEVASDLSGLSADDVTYDNTDSGLSSDTVQDAIDETVNKIDTINDDLKGFKFYPVGTAIVGLVSDDSPYTDANGNYILAASTTGQSMIDGVTYKSINSTVDARGKVGADSATPFKRGSLHDINPNKQKDALYIYGNVNGANFGAGLNVCGYNKVVLCHSGSATSVANNYYKFVKTDGTETNPVGPITISNTLTTGLEVDIPADAQFICMRYANAGSAGNFWYYALFV